MKRKIVGILVCMLMIGTVFVGVSGNKVVTPIERTNVLSTGQDEIIVDIPIGQYEINQANGYDEISVEDFGRLLIPGKPNLPSKIFAVGIPPGAELIEIDFDIGDGIVLPGTYNVPPVALPRVIGQENPDVYRSYSRCDFNIFDGRQMD